MMGVAHTIQNKEETDSEPWLRPGGEATENESQAGRILYLFIFCVSSACLFIHSLLPGLITTVDAVHYSFPSKPQAVKDLAMSLEVERMDSVTLSLYLKVGCRTIYFFPVGRHHKP